MSVLCRIRELEQVMPEPVLATGVPEDLELVLQELGKLSVVLSILAEQTGDIAAMVGLAAVDLIPGRPLLRGIG